MKIRKLVALLLTLTMILMLGACGSSNSTEEPEDAVPETVAAAGDEADADAVDFAETPTYTWRMSTESAEGEILSEFLQSYADAVYDATKGQVQIDLYLNNTLGAAEDVWALFTEGNIEMSHSGIAHAGSFPVSDIIQTPFVCGSSEEALTVLQTLADTDYLTEFTDYMHVCFYMPTLPQVIMTVNKEITTIDDLSGMVIRASSSPLIAAVENLGSTATSIAITDLYLGLSQGVADAALTSVDAAEAFSLQDVVKYMVDMPVSFGLNYTGINLSAWEALPEDIQQAIDEVNAEYQEAYLDMNDESGDAALQNMMDGGLTVLEASDELVQACKDATESQLDDLIENLNSMGYDGQAIVDTALSAIE